MSLKAVVTKEQHGKLSEGIQGEYKLVEEGPLAGNYMLDVEQSEVEADGKKAVYALEDINSLKGALQKERGSVEDLKKKIKDFEDLDPKEAREAMKKLKEMSDNPTDSEKYKRAEEALKKQLGEKHSAELKEVSDLLKQREDQLSDLLIDQAAKSAMSKHKLRDGGDVLLMPHIKEHVKSIKIDGKIVARVIDPETGQEMVSRKQGNNGPMDVAEFVERMSKDKTFKILFKGDETTGSEGDPPAKGVQRNGNNGNNRNNRGTEDPNSQGIHSTMNRQDPVRNLMEYRAKGSPKNNADDI